MAPLSELAVDIRLKQFPAVGKAPAVTALADLRFAVPPGELACVLGPSGCGKTTLLNIIAGLERAFEGRVTLPTDARRGAPVIGYVFQNPRLLPWRTVGENIELVLRPEQRHSDIVAELLAATGLAEFRDSYPERLSVGMSRRVALARAFAVEPDLLLMDEPFVSVDERTAERLRALLLEIWARRPTTVLFVSHDTREVVQLADRIIVLAGPPGAVEAVIPVTSPRAERADPARLEALRRALLGDRLALS